MSKLIEFILSLFKSSTKPEEEVKPMNKFLSDQDFRDLGTEFGIEPACIRAIFKVEAGGKSGFLSVDPSKPVTLEEGHIFYKYGKQKGLDVDSLCISQPTICYKKWTKQYYKTGLAEYARYELASSINKEVAMLATSWGCGQVMGFNYKACGYSSVFKFVEDMYLSEKLQLRAMCMFIKSNTKMFNALRNKDWSTFAYCYNGPSYKENKYDQKLQNAYNSYKNC